MSYMPGDRKLEAFSQPSNDEYPLVAVESEEIERLHSGLDGLTRASAVMDRAMAGEVVGVLEYDDDTEEIEYEPSTGVSGLCSRLVRAGVYTSAYVTLGGLKTVERILQR